MFPKRIHFSTNPPTITGTQPFPSTKHAGSFEMDLDGASEEQVVEAATQALASSLNLDPSAVDGWMVGVVDGLVGVSWSWVGLFFFLFLFFFRMAKHFENAGFFLCFWWGFVGFGVGLGVFFFFWGGGWFQQFLLVGWMLDREGSLKFKFVVFLAVLYEIPVAAVSFCFKMLQVG